MNKRAVNQRLVDAGYKRVSNYGAKDMEVKLDFPDKQMLCDEIDRLVVQRDRYKAALEQMLAEDNGGELSWQEIARKALNGPLSG